MTVLLQNIAEVLRQLAVPSNLECWPVFPFEISTVFLCAILENIRSNRTLPLQVQVPLHTALWFCTLTQLPFTATVFLIISWPYLFCLSLSLFFFTNKSLICLSHPKFQLLVLPRNLIRCLFVRNHQSIDLFSHLSKTSMCHMWAFRRIVISCFCAGCSVRVKCYTSWLCK